MADMEYWINRYPEKFTTLEKIFGTIHRGDSIFIGSACAEPQYLVQGMIRYVKEHPKAFFDAEVLSIRSLGIAPYANERFKDNFRHNSFFVGDSVRDAVNTGLADYTPIFLSQIPSLFRRGLDRVDVALIQTSLPDSHGYVSLGIGVDIAKAALEKAGVIIAQVNRHMPRTHGDGFLALEDINFIVPHDEEILEYTPRAEDWIVQQIGKYVAKLIEDGDTIQVGYGAIPNAILCNLSEKNNLGVHSELISDGVIDLMRKKVVDNTRKSIDRYKTVATFCMGTKDTYEFLDDNPTVEFRTIDYTNNPLIIAMQQNMAAINSALEIDLTGQATAESIGHVFYSGVGGQADFMRSAVMARGGKSILAIKSTAMSETRSRIVPALSSGAGATLIRGDMHYVVTEYGIAYLHGKNIRERAMSLIAIAHPKFRGWLLEEAKRAGLVYRDQAMMTDERGRYPEELETYRKTKTGLDVFFRPMKFTDEPLLKDFYHHMSDSTMYRRFMSMRKDTPHERLQPLVVIDYTKEMAIIAVVEEGVRETFAGVGRYYINPTNHTAEVAFAVRDDYQGRGIGTELLAYLTYLGKRNGLQGFTADVLVENEPMLHVFEKAGFQIEKRNIAGVYEIKMMFS